MTNEKERETYFDLEITLIVLGVNGIVSIFLGLFTWWIFGTITALILGSVGNFAFGCVLFFPVFGIHRTYKDSLTKGESRL